MSPRCKVGDTVWVAFAAGILRTRPCRVCAGKKEVVLILGSGEQVALSCDFCKAGMDPPSGTESYHDWGARAEPRPVTGLDISVNSEGVEEVRYRSGTDGGWTSYEAGRCYGTEEEALACCDTLVEERREEEARALAQKEKAQRSYSWNAGYFLREAERARKDAARYEERARLMKAKSGEAE